MSRRRWLLLLVAKSISFRRGRALLLLTVLAMASGLVTALGIVSASMDRRVAEEVRKYGANLVIIPETARIDVGSGGLNFGSVAEPAYLSQESAVRVATGERAIDGHSLHLKGELRSGSKVIPAEGVNFAGIRRLFPWWQVKGEWPKSGEVMVGSDLAAVLDLKPGARISLAGSSRGLDARVAGIVTTGGEEDKLLFVELAPLQLALGLEGKLSQVRLIARTGGESLERLAARLQSGFPGAQVREVRQVARTSEALLKKVQLLMALVTVVVVISSGGSVAGTMGTTVLERGKEIGLMKAMGGSRREVLLLFAAESLVLGLLGGVAGYLAGAGIASVVTRTVFAAPAEFIPWMAVVSLGAGLFLALAGSIGPMAAVYRLDPVQSLRGE